MRQWDSETHIILCSQSSFFYWNVSRISRPPGCGASPAPCNTWHSQLWSPPSSSSRPLSCWDQSVLISRQSFHHGKVTWSPRALETWAGGKRRSIWPSVSRPACVGAQRRTAAPRDFQHFQPSLTKLLLSKPCKYLQKFNISNLRHSIRWTQFIRAGYTKCRYIIQMISVWHF